MNQFDTQSLDFSKEFIDDTSKSDLAVANMAHFLSTDTATSSEFVTAINRKETEYTFISSESTPESTPEQEYFSAFSKTHSLNPLTNTIHEDLLFSIALADDELGFLKDVSIDSSSQESGDLKPVTNASTEDHQFSIASADDELEFLKDAIIDSSSQESGDLKPVTDASTENIQFFQDLLFLIASADDELEFLKDVSIDSSSQETGDLKPVTNTSIGDRQFPIASADDELEVLKYVIIHSSIYSSESTAFNARNLKSSLCQTIESLQSLTDIIDSQGPSIVKRTDTLGDSAMSKSCESSSCDSKSFEVKSSNISSTSNYNETLNLLHLKKEELFQTFTDRKKWRCNRVNFLKMSVMGLSIAFKSPAIKKSQRNVCIQGIYYRILYEVIDCVDKVLVEMNNTLKYIQENYDIQLRKVVELLEKFDTDESEHEIDFIDDSLKALVEKSIINLKRLDALAERRINDVDLLLVNNTKKFNKLSKLF